MADGDQNTEKPAVIQGNYGQGSAKTKRRQALYAKARLRELEARMGAKPEDCIPEGCVPNIETVSKNVTQEEINGFFHQLNLRNQQSAESQINVDHLKRVLEKNHLFEGQNRNPGEKLRKKYEKLFRKAIRRHQKLTLKFGYGSVTNNIWHVNKLFSIPIPPGDPSVEPQILSEAISIPVTEIKESIKTTQEELAECLEQLKLQNEKSNDPRIRVDVDHLKQVIEKNGLFKDPNGNPDPNKSHYETLFKRAIRRHQKLWLKYSASHDNRKWIPLLKLEIPSEIPPVGPQIQPEISSIPEAVDVHKIIREELHKFFQQVCLRTKELDNSVAKIDVDYLRQLFEKTDLICGEKGATDGSVKSAEAVRPQDQPLFPKIHMKPIILGDPDEKPAELSKRFRSKATGIQSEPITDEKVLEHFKMHFELLKKEDEEESKRQSKIDELSLAYAADKSGAAIMDLVIEEIGDDVDGTFHVALKSSNPNGFGVHRIKKKDCVMFSNIFTWAKDKQFPSGVVVDINTESLKLALPDHPSLLNLEVGQDKFYIMQQPDIISAVRLKDGLKKIINGDHNPISKDVIKVIFKQKPVSEPLKNEVTSFYNKELDESQKDAVNFSLNAKELAIIHGPPGTGKTTTLVEIILQLAKMDQKILICTASNLAIDNIQEKLMVREELKDKFVRIGNPVRVPNHLKKDTLSCQVFKDDLLQAKRLALKTANDKKYKEISGQMMWRKDRIEKRITMSTQIILSTLTSAWDGGNLAWILDTDRAFDVLIVDECSQSIQAATFIALTHAKKVILAGDHQQLPPVIKDFDSRNSDLAVSLMEKLLNDFKGSEDQIMRMLKIQYRMNEKIMRWSSNMFYNGQVVAHESCKNRTLEDKYPHLVASEYPPLLMIDTCNTDITEQRTDNGSGVTNEEEAELVVSYAKDLLASGVDKNDIGIITPYNKQVFLLRDKLKGTEIDVSTVDGFQGYEREIIILSMVRSNLKKSIGFLDSYRRLNVAVTRAKSHLVMVCDSITISGYKTIRKFIEVIRREGEVRYAQEDDGDEEFDEYDICIPDCE